MSEDMKRVFRYEVPVDDRPHTLQLTSNPRAVAMGRGPHVVEFWAEHAGDFPVSRTFQVYGTGHPVPASAKWWGTTPRMDGLVWHLYELPGGSEQGGEETP